MRNYFITTTLFLIVFCGSCYGQLFDFRKTDPYTKVFVETDAFDASYLSQLQEALKKIENDTLRFSVLNDLAYYWHTQNLDSALTFAQEGLRLTLQKDSLWYGRFQITQGAILLRQEKLDSAYMVLEQAKQKVKESDLGFLNTQLGYVFERRGQLGKAADYALESLRLGRKLNDLKAQALAYSDLSNLFWKQSKFEKGLEYGEKSLSHFEQWGLEDLDYDFTLYVVGNNYLALNNHKKALEYYERSIVIGERYGFYNNLSDVYISLVDLYAYLKQFNKAKEAGENAIKYAYLLDNAFMLMRSYLSVGKLQNQLGNYESAITNLDKSIEVATTNFGDEYYLSQAYQSLGEAYFQSENYKEAYVAYKEYDRLKGIIFTAEADQRISLLQTEFEVAQKESTIGLQENELKQQNTRQNLISLIAGLLLLFLILLFVGFTNNRKKNKLLQKQNREKEFLLKEIHHRVKNNLEVVSSLLALQSAHIKDPKIIDAMVEGQNRVHSMSMIHQRLYQGEDLAAIEMKDYFKNLGSHIIDSFGMEKSVNIVYAMQPIYLDVDTAVPLGLIVNELLTNTLKYAFPEKNGIITIVLNYKEKSLLSLVIADNGIGKQEDNIIQGTGFGTQLISLLTQQLEGTLKSETKKGTKISFLFKVKPI
ncbi:MAG TPA: tetratricopeptide repeat protein [Leeuwenhoekiella sp.]|nr:tetratricopeptide repeat protein [Leeuwenhoekiella sp.]